MQTTLLGAAGHLLERRAPAPDQTEGTPLSQVKESNLVAEEGLEPPTHGL